MGLDISLYLSTNPQAITDYEKLQGDEHEKIYQKLNETWGVSRDGKLTDAQWEEYKKKYEAWDAQNPCPGTETEVNQKSEIHPDHMFSIG